MRLARVCISIGLCWLPVVLPGCGDPGPADPTSPPVPPSVASITITGPDTVHYGATVQYTAITRDAKDSILTGQTITWASSNPGSASVSSSGGVSFVAAGTATVSATSGGVTGGKSVRAFGLRFTQIAAGQLFACGLTDGGAIYCWGDYSTGSTSNVPVLIPSTVVFVSVAAGEAVGGAPQVCGLSPAGVAYCWKSSLATATAVPSAPPFTELSLGAAHVCGVAVGSIAYCWGYNNLGQLGTGTPPVDHATPTAVLGALAFLQVSAGTNHTCGVTTGNAAYCWGGNGDGQVGAPLPLRADSPQVVSGGISFASVAAGFAHTCGVAIASSLYCWGGGSQGQLGSNTTASSSFPLSVAGGLSATAIDAGLWHTCAITTSAAAYCWGSNSVGQLGIGNTASDSVPQLVVGGLSYQALALGQNFSCALTTSSRAYCWGNNQFGQLGTPSVASSLVPVQVAGQN